MPLLLCIIASILFLSCEHVCATTFDALPPVKRVQPTLIGGIPVDPKLYEAVLYTRQGGSRCTSTIVGPRTLITASHCVDNGGTASFLLKGVNYNSKCVHHPDYDRNETADWALCYIDKTVAGIRFESLSMDGSIPKVGDTITLMGYGCTKPDGSGGNDGILRSGLAEVKRTPRNNDWDIVTQGKVALCFGDSGGPAFYLKGADRYLISINSRGNIQDTSYLSKTLSNPVFSDWIKAWATEKNTTICGVNIDCLGKSEPSPIPPAPKPEPAPPKPDASPSPLTGWLIIVGIVGLISAGVWFGRKKP